MATLATLLRRELDVLPPLSPMCCIYRVPERLRHTNDRAYTPQTVSIGPIHHGKKQLKPMEEHKKRYLVDFLNHTNKSLEDCIKMIKNKEEFLRGCYAELLELTSDEFVKIVLVDAAFIIEFLLRFSGNFYDADDWIFNKRRILHGIYCDLLLLENQIPFVILEELLDTVSFADGRRLSIFDLSYKVLKSIMGVGSEDKLRTLRGSRICHFVDFLRSLCVPLSGSGGNISITIFPKVTELHKAGVKFNVGSSGNLFGFQFSNGVLEIPKLNINDSTELILRNLLAFEQCHYKENYLSDFVVMMDCLVDTPEDFGLLVKYGIIDNGLGDNTKGSTLINRLQDELVFDSSNFYFAGICEELYDYYRAPWHKWKANLKQSYFNTPWASVSVIAAILLIILTIIQAVYWHRTSLNFASCCKTSPIIFFEEVLPRHHPSRKPNGRRHR